MKKECPYCRKEIVYLIQQKFAGHCCTCKKNPKSIKREQKRIKTVLEKRKDYKFICEKCNNIYVLNLTPLEFEKKKYKNHCSQICANTHIQTKEQNIKRSEKLKGVPHSKTLESFGKYKTININGKQLSEHKYIMEKYLSRKLKSNEFVHHINGDCSDNRIENLEVVNHEKHSYLHRIKKY